jgi:excisionase family DNA binding protein
MTAADHPLSGQTMLSIQDAAERTGLSVRTLRRYLADGRLDAVRIGRRLMCSASAVDAAVFSGVASQSAKRMVDPAWELRPVAEWMGEWERYCRIIESPTRPLEPRLRYLEAVSKRFGSLEVREYRLKHLAIVHRDAVAGGWAIDEVAMMLAMDLKMSVIDCVRRTQAVFAGHTDADDPGPRKAKRKEASNAKPTRNGRTRT